MEAWELEQLRRSVVMVQASSVGPMTKEAALALVQEAIDARQDRDRYRQAIDRLRAVLADLEAG